MTGYVCSKPLFEYKGWLFEYGRIGGPWPIRIDGELFKRAGKAFYSMFDEFLKEPDIEQYRIGGGCQEI